MSARAVEKDADHPDRWAPGLHYAVKALSARTVSRATGPEDALRIALRHILRINNADHRHRSRIDPSRTPLNMVMAGAADPEVAADQASATLAALGLTYPCRRDAVGAFEVIVQPPAGADATVFWPATLAWLRRKFEHIVAAVVHVDQRRAHLHAVVLPVLAGQMDATAMQRGDYGFPRQRQQFMAYLRAELGLRADRKVMTLADLAVSTGKGAKTRAAADRRDLALMRRTGAGPMGMEVGGHVRRPLIPPTSMPTTSNIAQHPAHAPAMLEAHRPPRLLACHNY